MTVYGLLGYAWNETADDYSDAFDYDGFAYGIGAKYAVIVNVEVFVDYTNVYDDNVDFGNTNLDATTYSVNVGATYKF